MSETPGKHRATSLVMGGIQDVARRLDLDIPCIVETTLDMAIRCEQREASVEKISFVC